MEISKFCVCGIKLSPVFSTAGDNSIIFPQWAIAVKIFRVSFSIYSNDAFEIANPGFIQNANSSPLIRQKMVQAIIKL